MSYAEDNNHDLDPEFLGLCGSDYDLDTERIQLIWVCKDGKEMKIEDMSTSHILNCIAMLQKQKNASQRFLEAFKEELQNRMFLEAMRSMPKEEFNKIIHREKK